MGSDAVVRSLGVKRQEVADDVGRGLTPLVPGKGEDVQEPASLLPGRVELSLESLEPSQALLGSAHFRRGEGLPL